MSKKRIGSNGPDWNKTVSNINGCLTEKHFYFIRKF